MDEWMLLTSGEAEHRQREQRALRKNAQLRQATATELRVRAVLATALVALAARLDATALLAGKDTPELLAPTRA